MRIARLGTVLFALVAGLTLHPRAADGPYQFIKEVAIGGSGSWDYLNVDTASKRLLISHGTTVAVYDIISIDLLKLDLRQYGDIAVALTEYHQDATVRGSPRSGDFLITDAWIKRDGRWQVVARSSILVAKP